MKTYEEVLAKTREIYAQHELEDEVLELLAENFMAEYDLGEWTAEELIKKLHAEEQECQCPKCYRQRHNF